MKLFVDASAMIAMITGEPEADALADRLEAARSRLCSPVAVWETVAGLCRSYIFSVESARGLVRDFLDQAGITYVSIGEREYELALAAYGQFGTGRHPAGLNMGDCFAYGCARANEAGLLYKGEDFAKTDMG